MPSGCEFGLWGHNPMLAIHGDTAFSCVYLVLAVSPDCRFCIPAPRRRKFHIVRFRASTKSSLIPLLLLSPKSLATFRGPHEPQRCCALLLSEGHRTAPSCGARKRLRTPAGADPRLFRPLRQPRLAASATGGARRRCPIGRLFSFQRSREKLPLTCSDWESSFSNPLCKKFLPPTNSHWERVNHKSFLKIFSHYVWTMDGAFLSQPADFSEFVQKIERPRSLERSVKS